MKKLTRWLSKQKGVTLLELAVTLGVGALITAPLTSTLFLLVAVPQVTTGHSMTANQIANTGQWLSTDFRSAQRGTAGVNNTVATVGNTDFADSSTLYKETTMSWLATLLERNLSSDGSHVSTVNVSRFIPQQKDISVSPENDISPDLVRANVRWETDVPGTTIVRNESILNFMRSPARKPPAGGFVMFSMGDIKWSGSKGVVLGNVHANGVVTISGSNHFVAGFVEGVNNVVLNGDDPIIEYVNGRGALLGMPISFDKNNLLPYDFSFIGDVDLSNVPEVWLDVEKRQLKPGVYHATGNIQLSGSNVSGSVTFIANEINISGSDARLFAYRDNLLLMAEGAGPSFTIDLAGSDELLRGIVYAPNGSVKMSGSTRRLDGSIFAASIDISGSKSWLAFASDLFPPEPAIRLEPPTPPPPPPPPIPPPGPFKFVSGSYVGDGADNRPITGVGFQPDVVIIKGDIDKVAVMRTATMAGDSTKPLVGDKDLTENMIQSLDTDGFTVGNDGATNRSSVSYYWMAFRAGEEDMRVGSYVGSGTSQSIIGLGFPPGYVIVMSASSNEAVHRSSAMASTFFFDGDSGDTNRIRSMYSDGFNVGSSSRVNRSGTIYHYVVWKTAAGHMNVGSYVGNGADNRSITGVGFQPDYLIIRPNGDASQRDAVHKSAATGASTDTTMDFRSSANDTNEIQALEADGFQVGSDRQANESGKTFYWMAFSGAIPGPTPTPTPTPIVSLTPTPTPLPTATPVPLPTATPTPLPTATPVWATLPNTPATVRYGGALATDGTNLYALRGGNTSDFWTFNVSSNAWASLANTPASVKEGGALVHANGYIYAYRGASTTGFWRYHVASDTWQTLANAPGSVAWGSALAWDGADSIYAFRGNNKQDFWRYSISNNQWTALANAPSSVSYGGALVHISGNLYAFRGKNTKDFWRYDVNSNSWRSLSAAPGTVEEGGALASSGGDSIYALRGDKSKDFWRYSIAANAWTSLQSTPSSVDDGGALAYLNGGLYALPGDSKKDFWNLANQP